MGNLARNGAERVPDGQATTVLLHSTFDLVTVNDERNRLDRNVRHLLAHVPQVWIDKIRRRKSRRMANDRDTETCREDTEYPMAVSGST